MQPDSVQPTGFASPCQNACPVGTDAEGYVAAVAEGRYLDAFRLARANNPFVSVCARVCEAPCEAACTRAERDGHPVAIRALKRFVTELYGVESVKPPELSTGLSEAPGDIQSHANGKRVLIVGAGVSGLSAFHSLARLGYDCTLAEKEASPGGRLRKIDKTLLATHIIDLEINAILSYPHTLLVNTGALPTETYDAVIIATGLDAYNYEGNLPVFKTGQSRLGEASIINSIADGQKAAHLVHSSLSGVTLQETFTSLEVDAPKSWTEDFGINAPREEPPEIPEGILPDGFVRGLPYTEATAITQAKRCLRCHINRGRAKAVRREWVRVYSANPKEISSK